MARIDANTVTVITGAAGGIGKALATEMDSRGATVVLLDTDRDGLDRLATGLKRCSTYCCDVADPQSVADVAVRAIDSYGGVQLLINNAGISAAGPVEDTALNHLRHVMDVNFWGVVHCCRTFLPHLRASALRGQPAAICNVLSDFALISLPTKAAYAASKHAARALTEALGAELYGTGVTVTAAYPGATATAIADCGYAVDEVKRAREAEFLAKGMRPEDVARKILRGVERGRIRVLIGRDAWMFDAASRLAPGLIQAAMRRYWRRVPFL